MSRSSRALSRLDDERKSKTSKRDSWHRESLLKSIN
jgi:hypothetical protein